MRVKYLFVYIGAGAAFLLVSLWVFLSKGKSTKAVRAKYVLGGVLISAWGLFTAASCEGPFQVTCYEPAVTCYDVEMPQVTISAKEGGRQLKAGDVLVVRIDMLEYETYRLEIKADESVLQSWDLPASAFSKDNENEANQCEVTLDAVDYKGDVLALISGVVLGAEGKEESILLRSFSFTLE